jgi:hypothetical protein
VRGRGRKQSICVNWFIGEMPSHSSSHYRHLAQNIGTSTILVNNLLDGILQDIRADDGTGSINLDLCACVMGSVSASKVTEETKDRFVAIAHHLSGEDSTRIDRLINENPAVGLEAAAKTWTTLLVMRRWLGIDSEM